MNTYKIKIAYPVNNPFKEVTFIKKIKADSNLAARTKAEKKWGFRFVRSVRKESKRV